MTRQHDIERLYERALWVMRGLLLMGEVHFAVEWIDVDLEDWYSDRDVSHHLAAWEHDRRPFDLRTGDLDVRGLPLAVRPWFDVSLLATTRLARFLAERLRDFSAAEIPVEAVVPGEALVAHGLRCPSCGKAWVDGTTIEPVVAALVVRHQILALETPDQLERLLDPSALSRSGAAESCRAVLSSLALVRGYQASCGRGFDLGRKCCGSSLGQYDWNPLQAA